MRRLTRTSQRVVWSLAGQHLDKSKLLTEQVQEKVNRLCAQVRFAPHVFDTLLTLCAGHRVLYLLAAIRGLLAGARQLALHASIHLLGY